MNIRDACIESSGDVVTIQWSGGTTARFHSVWLRLESPSGDTRSASNGQRLITIGDIASTTVVSSVTVASDGGSVQISFLPEHQADFDATWLFTHRYDLPLDEPPTLVTDETLELWDAGSLQHRIPTATFGDIAQDPRALTAWLHAIHRYGFAHLSGLEPVSGALCQVVDLFGYIRETNYGRWFDVRAEVNPSNLAYTSLGLQAHTDNPYRDPVPTLQLLACLENSVVGGESTVVDGFAAAARLRHEQPDAFYLLSHYPARFEYAGSADVWLQAKRPVLEVGPDGELLAVRFNSRSWAPLVDVPFDHMQSYLAAYRRLAEIIDDPSMQVHFALEPGDLFIVNNTRVLHARTSFSSSGQRWLQGCYADIDGLLSRLLVLQGAP